MSALRLRKDGRVVFHGPDYGIRQISLGHYRRAEFIASESAVARRVLADPRTREWFATRQADPVWMAWLSGGRGGPAPQVETGDSARSESRECFRRFHRIVKRLRDAGHEVRTMRAPTGSLYAYLGAERKTPILRASDHPEPITRHVTEEWAQVSLYPEMSRADMDAAEEKLMRLLP